LCDDDDDDDDDDDSCVDALYGMPQPYEEEKSYYDWLRKGYVQKREKLAAALSAAGIVPMKVGFAQL
jgi:hypothetical protein